MRPLIAFALLCLCAIVHGANAATVTLDSTYTSGSSLPILTLSGGVDSYAVTLPANYRAKPTVQFRTDGDIIRGDAQALSIYTKNLAGEAFDVFVVPASGTNTRTIYIQGTAGLKVYAEIKSYPGQQ